MIGFHKAVVYSVEGLNPGYLKPVSLRCLVVLFGTPEESQLYRQEAFPAVALNPSPTIEEHREEIKS